MELEVEEKGRGKVLYRVYYQNSMIDEFYADDIVIQDDFYFAVKDKKPVAVIPKTYFIRCIQKE